MTWTAHSSKACSWNNPRPHQDASARFRKHGPLLPMEEPSFLERFLARIMK